MENETPVVTTKSENYCTLTGIRYRGENYQKLCGMPDSNSFRDGIYFFKSSHANIKYIVENWDQIRWDQESRQKFEEWHKFIIVESSNKCKKDVILNSTPIDMGDLVSKTKPFDHQLQAFNLSKNLPEFGLFFEQGCGKTKVIIDNSRFLFDRNKIECLIVIAPNGVHDNWVDDELPIHMSGQYEAMAWQSSFSKKSKAKWNKIKESEHLKIFTFNVECFRSEKGKSEIIGLLERFKCMIVVDESQKIKTPSALRTKFIVKIGLKGIYRRILSGTPVTKGSEDFYSQLKFLNPNILGITAFAGFKNRYCQMGGWEGKVIVGYKNIEELQDKVDKYSMRVLKKDCLDLPEKLYQFSYFDLTKTQLDMIKQIKADGVAAIKDIKGDVTDEFLLEYVISRMIKIQQISNGYYYDTENKKVIEIIPFDKNPRLLKLKEDLDKIEGKVIIWCRFKEDIKLISKLLKFMGKSFAVYDGSVSQDDRKKNKKDFQDGLLDVLLLNIQTGATGLTLTVASNTIYFDNSYDLELRLQSEDRNHRIGTKYNVLYTDLVANDTPEKKIITALKRKKSISEIILKDPAGFFLEEK